MIVIWSGFMITDATGLCHQVHRDSITHPAHHVIRNFASLQLLGRSGRQKGQDLKHLAFVLEAGLEQQVNVLRGTDETVHVDGHAAHHDVTGTCLIELMANADQISNTARG